jgi:hypothetical protein
MLVTTRKTECAGLDLRGPLKSEDSDFSNGPPSVSFILLYSVLVLKAVEKISVSV